MSEGAIFFPLMQLNVNTYANSVIESSFTLMKFMEVVMNVYLRFSINLLVVYRESVNLIGYITRRLSTDSQQL